MQLSEETLRCLGNVRASNRQTKAFASVIVFVFLLVIVIINTLNPLEDNFTIDFDSACNTFSWILPQSDFSGYDPRTVSLG